jgi:hypothetical protein
MKALKILYIESYWFWVVSKIIMSILLLLSTLSLLGASGLRPHEFLINFIGFIEGVLLIATLFQDFSSNPKFGILKIITGILMILFGIGILIALLTVSEGSRSDAYILGYPFSIG